jgi:hypothetical protein
MDDLAYGNVKFCYLYLLCCGVQNFSMQLDIYVAIFIELMF